MVEHFKPQEGNNGKNNKTLSVKCKHCKSQNYIKHGYRKTQNRGRIQKYFCNNCKQYFTMDNGFYRMRNSEDKITEGIDLYFSNLSSRKVRNHFRRHRPQNTSHVTVLDWCRKYVLKVTKYVDTLQPQLMGRYYMDETEIDCSGRNDFFWVAVDWDTRFIPNTHYSLFWDTNNCKEFLRKIKKKKVPKYVQTDSAPFYKNAFYDMFKKSVKHYQNNVHETGKHNVRIETVFSKVKDRVDDFRGLKATWSAPILLQGIIIQHNFIEAHTTTGKIPSELAGLKLDCGINRWLGLIKLASSK